MGGEAASPPTLPDAARRVYPIAAFFVTDLSVAGGYFLYNW